MLAVATGGLDVSEAPPAAAATIHDLKTAIYTEPLNGDACIRLLRAEGVVGCAAPGAGPVTGPLAAADAATAAGALPRGAVAVVPAAAAGAFLQRCSTDAALRSRLAGVLLEHSDEFPGWNPAAAAPLAEYALYDDASSYPWNPAGERAVGCVQSARNKLGCGVGRLFEWQARGLGRRPPRVCWRRGPRAGAPAQRCAARVLNACPLGNTHASQAQAPSWSPSLSQFSSWTT